MMKIGFLGLGNMASAIIRGMKASGKFQNDIIIGFDRHKEKAEALQVVLLDSIQGLFSESDVLVFAVKPQSLTAIMESLPAQIDKNRLFVSIAAGKSLSWFEAYLGAVSIVRVMPNINSLVGCGVSAICGNSTATEEQLSLVKSVFSSIGSVYELSETHFSAFSAIAGASPAYSFMYIDALASAAVKAGIPKALALSISTDAVLGSAKLLRESGTHPSVLADQVCSPGGTTIEGVHALREYGFENAVYKAIDAVIEKDKRL